MVVTPETSPPLADVRELPAGDKITGFYLLAKIETKPKRNGEPYLELRLQDASGHLDAKMWELFAEITAAAKAGDIVKVEGVVDVYNDLPQLIVSRIRLATPEEAPDRRSFLPHSPLAPDEARRILDEIVASVNHGPLRALLASVFADSGVLDRFLDAPAGKMWHHAALGGLAEHSLSLARLASHTAAHYSDLNRDLLVAGALLHDVGKIFELTHDPVIDYSAEGRLLGHIVMGAAFVERKIAELDGFPTETRRQLLHLILSHQGDGAMGSPVRPMTLEAIVLHYLDELDSKTEAFLRERAKTPAGQELSKYINLMNRFFYFKPIESGDATGGES